MIKLWSFDWLLPISAGPSHRPPVPTPKPQWLVFPSRDMPTNFSKLIALLLISFSRSSQDLVICTRISRFSVFPIRHRNCGDDYHVGISWSSLKERSFPEVERTDLPDHIDGLNLDFTSAHVEVSGSFWMKAWAQKQTIRVSCSGSSWDQRGRYWISPAILTNPLGSCPCDLPPQIEIEVCWCKRVLS